MEKPGVVHAGGQLLKGIPVENEGFFFLKKKEDSVVELVILSHSHLR